MVDDDDALLTESGGRVDERNEVRDAAEINDPQRVIA